MASFCRCRTHLLVFVFFLSVSAASSASVTEGQSTSTEKRADANDSEEKQLSYFTTTEESPLERRSLELDVTDTFNIFKVSNKDSDIFYPGKLKNGKDGQKDKSVEIELGHNVAETTKAEFTTVATNDYNSKENLTKKMEDVEDSYHSQTDGRLPPTEMPEIPVLVTEEAKLDRVTESISDFLQSWMTVTEVNDDLQEDGDNESYNAKEFDPENEDESYIEFPEDSENEAYIEQEDDSESEEVSFLDAWFKRKQSDWRKGGKRKTNKRKRKRNKKRKRPQKVDNFVTLNGHEESFQEDIEDFNLTLVELNIKRLTNTSASRDTRQMVYADDVPLGEHMPSQDGLPVESVSLWDYFLGLISGEPQQSREKTVIVEKVLEHPCDNLPGEFSEWLQRAEYRQVIVIGGGVAGLSALRTLNKLGLTDSLLLEASSRLGGRLHTIRHAQWVVEEGIPLIQGEALNPLFQMAFELGDLGGPIPMINWDEDVFTSSGDMVDHTVVHKGNRIVDRLRHDPRERSSLRYYHDMPLGELYSSRFDELWGPTKDEKDKQAWMYYVHQLISGKFGANSWMNVAARDASNFADLGRDITWKGGMDKLVQYLMQDISGHQLRLSSPVCQVFWDMPDNSSPLVVMADGTAYRADYLVSALSLGVLKNYNYRTFFPPLPKTLLNAFESVDAGVVDRIILGWDRPWWGPKPFRMQVLWRDFNFPIEMEWMSNIVDVRSNPEHPSQLEMEVFGEAASAMEEMDTETLIAHLVTFLRTTKRNYNIPLPSFIHRSKWSQNVWARGSYHSYMNMNAVNFAINDRSSLNPVLSNSRGAKSLCFAGEHTSTDRYGTVDGALLSGARAARCVMDEQAIRGKLYLVADGQKSRLLPLDDQEMNVDYYQFFKNPTLTYQAALSVKKAKKAKAKAEQKEKKKNKQSSSKSSKEQKKRKKSKKPPHENEQKNSNKHKGDDSSPDLGKKTLEKEEPISSNPSLSNSQKQSRFSDVQPRMPMYKNPPAAYPSEPTTTTLAIKPIIHPPVHFQNPVGPKPGVYNGPPAKPFPHDVILTSFEHFNGPMNTDDSNEVTVVYVNSDGEPIEKISYDYNPSSEISFVYVDRTAEKQGDAQHSVMYVEAPMNAGHVNVFDTVATKNSNSARYPHELSEGGDTVGSKEVKRIKGNRKRASLEAGESRANPTYSDDSLEKKKDGRVKKGSPKRRKNRRKGNNGKKSGKKNKRKKHNRNKSNQRTTDLSPLHSGAHNPYLSYPGGMISNNPHYIPYPGLRSIDHLSLLSHPLGQGTIEKTRDFSIEKSSKEAEAKSRSSEVKEAAKAPLLKSEEKTEDVLIPEDTMKQESIENPENFASRKGIDSVQGKIGTTTTSSTSLPLLSPQTTDRPFPNIQSNIQNVQHQSLQSPNSQSQKFQPPMNGNPSHFNQGSNIHLNEQNVGNTYSFSPQQQVSSLTGLTSNYNRQNTFSPDHRQQAGNNNNNNPQLLYLNSQNVGHYINSQENAFRQANNHNAFGQVSTVSHVPLVSNFRSQDVKQHSNFMQPNQNIPLSISSVPTVSNTRNWDSSQSSIEYRIQQNIQPVTAHQHSTGQSYEKRISQENILPETLSASLEKLSKNKTILVFNSSQSQEMADDISKKSEEGDEDALDQKTNKGNGRKRNRFQSNRNKSESNRNKSKSSRSKNKKRKDDPPYIIVSPPQMFLRRKFNNRGNNPFRAQGKHSLKDQLNGKENVTSLNMTSSMEKIQEGEEETDIETSSHMSQNSSEVSQSKEKDHDITSNENHSTTLTPELSTVHENRNVAVFPNQGYQPIMHGLPFYYPFPYFGQVMKDVGAVIHHIVPDNKASSGLQMATYLKTSLERQEDSLTSSKLDSKEQVPRVSSIEKSKTTESVKDEENIQLKTSTQRAKERAKKRSKTKDGKRRRTGSRELQGDVTVSEDDAHDSELASDFSDHESIDNNEGTSLDNEASVSDLKLEETSTVETISSITDATVSTMTTSEYDKEYQSQER